MNIQEFEALHDIEKGEAVLHATYINSRIEPGYKVSLYAIDAFYVEVFYSDILNEIFQLKPFNSVNMLDPYLKNLSVRNFI